MFCNSRILPRDVSTSVAFIQFLCLSTERPKIGSEQESDEVPDWRGFRDFVPSGEFDSSSVRSADAGSADGIAETGREPYFQRSHVRLRPPPHLRTQFARKRLGPRRFRKISPL